MFGYTLGAYGRGVSPAFAPSLASLRASVFAELAPAIAKRKAAGLPLAPLHIGDTAREPGATLSLLPSWATDNASYAYGPLGGVPQLREALAARFSRERLVPTGAASILVTVGATHGLLSTVRACCDAGTEVVVLTPYWPLSVGVIRCAGAVPVEVPFSHHVTGPGGVERALAAVRGSITPRTRALYFASPNNPCGAVYTQEILTALAEIAEAHDLWIFVDEVYADYTYDSPFISAARMGLARVVVVCSLSKSHGIAGARIGFVRADPDVLGEVAKVATHSAFHPSIQAQGLAYAAISSESWVQEARAEYMKARLLTTGALRKAGVAFLPPQGGSYVFADFGPWAECGSVQPVFERFIEAGVLVCPGLACGQAFETHARICFTAVRPDEIAAAMQRLTATLAL